MSLSCYSILHTQLPIQIPTDNIWQKVQLSLNWSLTYWCELNENWKKTTTNIETTLQVTARETICWSTHYNFLETQLRELLADLHPKRTNFLIHFVSERKHQYLKYVRFLLSSYRNSIGWQIVMHFKSTIKSHRQKNKEHQAHNHNVLLPTCSKLLAFARRTGLTLVWITWSI